MREMEHIKTPGVDTVMSGEALPDDNVSEDPMAAMTRFSYEGKGVENEFKNVLLII